MLGHRVHVTGPARLKLAAELKKRLHEHLGMPPGPLTFDMVKKAAEIHLAESDDLDWKEHLAKPPYDGRWNELAKDVAAMANTRGGLLIFGVTDQDTAPVGINSAQANIAQTAP